MGWAWVRRDLVESVLREGEEAGDVEARAGGRADDKDRRADVGRLEERLLLHRAEERYGHLEDGARVQAEDEVPHAEAALGGERVQEEAEEPLGGDEGHREREGAQVRGELGQLLLQQLLEHLLRLRATGRVRVRVRVRVRLRVRLRVRVRVRAAQ